ncbi:putative RNA-directed DNA polymerase, eukaryota, reverse transcriptase zinc-binding domain protein [Tanacetum coccineum]
MCGSQKSPVQMVFLKSYWELLKEDVRNAVRCVFDSFVMPQGVNSSFITLIPKISNPIHIKDFRPISLIAGRQILDGLMVLSELMSWYKKKKKKLMLFKVDFEKAFDTVSWKYLDHMLLSLGFGSKWRRWIQVCLHSARSSVLVNDSLSSEFLIKRGLRQGDPLSHFLFIIVMEGLHIAMQNAVCSGLIREAEIGTSGHKISHLFYTDDVVIISDWNNQDMGNIIRVLQVFYLASGLKINVSKSNVFGLGVSSRDVEDMASDTGCGLGNIPFSYLGLPLGANMHLTANWQLLIDRFRAKLSAWKDNTLSIGDRPDSWRWNLENDGIFTVHVTRSHIDACMLPSISPCTSWLKVLPRKVNVFIWHFIMDRLPTLLNLSLRGIEIPSIECPICNSGMESVEHIFFDCDVASNIWRLVRVWTDIDMPSFSSWFDWYCLFDDWRASRSDKDRVHVIIVALFWCLWRFRNSVTFSSNSMRKSDIFDSIRLFFFRGLKVEVVKLIVRTLGS